MEMTIKSRNTGEIFSFFMPSGGGYIYLQTKDRPGTLGRQICHGGGFMGSTIEAVSEEGFKSACRRWYRAYTRHQ